MVIFWTPTAKITYLETLSFIEEQWSIKEIEKFVVKTNRVLTVIQNSPYAFSSSKKNEFIRKAIISRQTSFYFRISPANHRIELLTFWANRMNPQHLQL